MRTVISEEAVRAVIVEAVGGDYWKCAHLYCKYIYGQNGPGQSNPS